MISSSFNLPIQWLLNWCCLICRYTHVHICGEGFSSAHWWWDFYDQWCVLPTSFKLRIIYLVVENIPHKLFQIIFIRNYVNNIMFNTCKSFQLSPNCPISKILSCKGIGTQIIVMAFVTFCIYVILLTFIKML